MKAADGQRPPALAATADGFTPLHFAVKSDKPEAFEVFARDQRAIDMRNKHGKFGDDLALHGVQDFEEHSARPDMRDLMPDFNLD